MKRWIAVSAAAALLGCGKSSSPVYDGGIVGTPPSGSNGFSFTPTDGAALVVGPIACTSGTVTAHFSGLLVGFSGYPNFCGFVRSHGIDCAESKGSSTFVGFEILKAGLASVTSVGAGTYDVNTIVSVGAEYVMTGASVTVNDATCNDTGPNPDTNPVGGTITITSASAADVKGSLDLTWTGGGFSGPFEVVGCTVGLDVCGLVNGGTTGCSGCF